MSATGTQPLPSGSVWDLLTHSDTANRQSLWNHSNKGFFFMYNLFYQHSHFQKTRGVLNTVHIEMKKENMTKKNSSVTEHR